MSSTTTTETLIQCLNPLIHSLGYEVVHLEVQNNRQKILRLFIDRLENEPDGQAEAIGIEDCVKVTKALDEPLEANPEVDKAFGGAAYELEVSSPGVDRPLRVSRDFERFKGRQVRIHTYRPLTGEELGNADYQLKNPKQKNFLGTLLGMGGGMGDEVNSESVALEVNLMGSVEALKVAKKISKTGAKKGASTNSAAGPKVRIPLPLISKANLEPVFDLDSMPLEESE
jgi:ribosome maturation factor RimP